MKARGWWEKLHPAVKSLVEEAGFRGLVASLHGNDSRRDLAALIALVERWQDTTHTFHFRWGEVTFTPRDLFVLTGVECSGEPLTLNAALKYINLRRRITYYERMLGFVPTQSGGNIRLTEILAHWERRRPQTALEGHQCARAFILYLVGTTLYANSGGTISVAFVPILARLSELPGMDWGTPALGFLYKGLDGCCRNGSTFQGHCSALLVSTCLFPCLVCVVFFAFFLLTFMCLSFFFLFVGVGLRPESAFKAQQRDHGLHHSGDVPVG